MLCRECAVHGPPRRIAKSDAHRLEWVTKEVVVLDWLSAQPAPTLTGEPRPRPGPILSDLAPAPFRILLQGDALVAGDGETRAGVRTIRATPDGIEIDGSLVALP